MWIQVKNQSWMKSDFSVKDYPTIIAIDAHPKQADTFKCVWAKQTDLGKVYIDPIIQPDPDGYQLATQGLDSAGLAREWRDSELKSTDWIYPLGDHPKHAAYVAYRKALRDWPSTADFPAKKPVLE